MSPSSSSPPRRRILWILGTLLLLGTGAFLGLYGERLWRRVRERPSAGPVVQSSAGVVVAVRDLARLEGAEFQVERVVSLTDKQSRLFGLVEATDALLLIASGTITAGVDLAGLTDRDFEFDPASGSVTITLPASRVFAARLDNERTKVWRRETDLLAARRESLETRARQEAERELLDAAKEEGIVKRSNDNVKRTVESVVKSLGYREVRVEFREEGGILPGSETDLEKSR